MTLTQREREPAAVCVWQSKGTQEAEAHRESLMYQALVHLNMRDSQKLCVLNREQAVTDRVTAMCDMLTGCSTFAPPATSLKSTNPSK